ncbi:hypothetical protein D3C76_735390 [compost metagenome]
MASMTLQQQQPRALHQSVEGDALTLGEAVQLARRLGVEVAVHHAMAGACGTRCRGQDGRRFEGRQALTPEAFRLCLVLALQPGDVVGVTPGQRRQAVVVVQAQHLAQQARSTPAVQQQVMVDPDHLVAVFAQAHQHKAHQRRAAQVETLGLFGGRQFTQRLFSVAALTPVEFFDRQLDTGEHRLQRIGQAVAPAERGAQHFMALDQRLPGRTESRHLQTVHRHAQLVDVGVELRRFEAMEQHALLHRRQRIQVLQPLTGGHFDLWHQRKCLDGWRFDQRGFTRARHRGQCTNGLLLEQLLGTEHQPTLPGTAHRLQRDDRVTAQFEEVFGDAHRVQAQQFLPDLHQQCFRQRRGGHLVEALT